MILYPEQWKAKTTHRHLASVEGWRLDISIHSTKYASVLALVELLSMLDVVHLIGETGEDYYGGAIMWEVFSTKPVGQRR